MTTIITGWSPEGWRLYGQRMVSTFRRFWPKTTRLIAYVERIHRTDGCEQRLIGDCEGLKGFLGRHKNVPLYNGREIGQPRKWKRGYIQSGYNFRYDAVKFGRVAFYIRDAMKYYPDPIMAWLDGDTYTFRAIPTDFVERLIPEDAAVAYLGRGGVHSEIGFLGFRMPAGLPVAAEFAGLYDRDEFIQLREYHSAFVFDTAVALCREVGTVCHNMTPNGHGHVWFQSLLGSYMDHCKGDKRKENGHSLEVREGR